MLSKIILRKNKVILSFLLSIVSIYIILFEFIIPANKILPKPSILLESIPSLINDYNFGSSFLLTFSAIYATMLISYFLISVSNSFLIKILNLFPGFKELFVISKYFIPLFLIFLFQLWFGDSLWAEYLFLLIIIMGFLKESVADNLGSLKQEYIVSAKSLGLTENEINSKVIWKSIQPNLFKSLKSKHISIWSLVIIYEYICNTGGVGSIFSLAIKYHDLSLVIVMFTSLIIAILVMEYLLEIVMKKYFYWN